jgi:hypothetical protein
VKGKDKGFMRLVILYLPIHRDIAAMNGARRIFVAGEADSSASLRNDNQKATATARI